MTQLDFQSFAAGVPVTTSDKLQIIVNAPDAGWSFDLITREVLKDGTIVESTELLTYTNGATTRTFLVNLTTGILSFVSLKPAVTVPNLGNMFATIAIVRGNATPAPPALFIASGWLSTSTPLTFPQLNLTQSQSILGGWTNADVSDPGPGVSPSIPITPSAKIQTLSFDLATDATAVVRTVELIIDGPSNIKTLTYANLTQGAGVTQRYYLWTGPNMPARLGTSSFIPWPDIVILTGDSLSITALNFQAGDEFRNITVDTLNQVGV